MDWNKLMQAPRLLMEAELKPALGVRFQPTGFADLGAAEFKAADGTLMLLVESAQSVANRLEATCLAENGSSLREELAGLPYVVATLEGSGRRATNSLIEAHRMASPYFLLNKSFKHTIVKEMDYDPKKPLDWKKICQTIFKYDTNSLIHGVFLSLLEGGRVRVPRALTGFIEARRVERAVSGGVKNSPVDPKGELQVADAEASERGVYSNVPYARVEYTAERISAYFNLDVALIRGYGLGDSAARLLVALSLLKVQRFLRHHLRLRTACDLEMRDHLAVVAPVGFSIPDEKELIEEVKVGITACRSQFAQPPITELVTVVKTVAKKAE